MVSLRLACVQVILVASAAVHAALEETSREWTECTEDCGGGNRDLLPYKRRRWTMPCNAFPCNLKAPEGCACPSADIYFIIDRSNSIKEPKYWRLKQFMQDFVNAYNKIVSDDVSKNQVRFAAASFDKFAQREFDFDEGFTLANRLDLLDEIWDLEYAAPAAGTNTPEGLYLANMIQLEQGRHDKPEIAFIVTDGRATNRKFLSNAIDTLHEHFRSIFALGIGNIDKEEIFKLVKDDKTHGFLVDDFISLPDIIQAILDAFCCSSVKKKCSEQVTGRCDEKCGPGKQSVSQICKVYDADGNEIGEEPVFYLQDCCNGPCTGIKDYCANNPCKRGECSVIDNGFRCVMPDTIPCPEI